MMYKLNETYINATEIVTITCDDSSVKDYPFRLAVKLKDGRAFSVRYKDRLSRDRVVGDITRYHDNTCPRPVGRYELMALLDKQTGQIRRSLREIKKLLKAGSGE